MHDALWLGDLTEDERARTVYECHLGIEQELYLRCWESLDSRFRSAWRAYIEQERAIRGTVQRDCRRQGH